MRRSRIAVDVCAGLSAGAAVLVLVGWATETAALVRWSEGHPPVQPNTAVAIILVAIALLAWQRNASLAVAACSTAIAICVVTLVEYVIDRDLIDTLLVAQPFYVGDAGHVGRPAPNTAASLALLAIGIAATALRPRLARVLMVVASATGAIAVVAGYGYISDLAEASTWGSFTRMAPLTAVVLTILSVATFIASHEAAPAIAPPYEVAAGLAVLTIVLATWRALVASASTERTIEADKANGALLLLAAIIAILFALLTRALGEARAGRRRAEVSEHRVAGIVAALGEGVVVAEPEVGFTLSNAAAAEILGLSTEELEGRGPTDAAWMTIRDDGQPFPASEQPIVRTMATGEPVDDVHMGVRRPDGSIAWIDVRTRPLSTPGSAVASFRDVTELRAARLELARWAQRLEQSNEDLLQFAYVASHDLREPLRTIGGYVDLLADEVGRDSSAGDYIPPIERGLERMNQLIDDLLQYSRVDRDPQPAVDVDLRMVIDDAVAALAASISSKGAQVTVSGDLPRVTGHPRQLSLLFQNLLGNAMTYVAPGVTPVVTVDASRAGGDVTVTIADNGIGVAENEREAVFAMFKRLHARDRYPGTGMGLAICRKIVDRHHGRIWIDENPGTGGSVVTVVLPAGGRADDQGDGQSTTGATSERNEPTMSA